MRIATSAAFLCGLALSAICPRAALAQAQGTYPATLACDPTPGAGRERAPLELRLGADGQASYRARLASRGVETGSGVLAGRRLVLTGSLAGPAGHAARYAGEITGRGGLLTGTRTPNGGGKALACQVILGDG